LARSTGQLLLYIKDHTILRTNSLRLETKSEDETKDIETAIANMTAAFNTKMAANDKAANDNEAAFRKRIDDLELRLNRPGSHANDNKEPTAETKAFETFIRKGREGLSGDEFKSLRVSDDTAGGTLAPDAFQAELDRNVVQFSPVRSVARVLPTGSPAVTWPKRTGGMTASWVGEVSDRPETTVTFGAHTYSVREIAAYVDVSNAMLEDSTFDVPSLLNFEFAEEFGVKEGAAFVNGTGVVSPSGFMQDSSLSYTAGGSASAVTSDGLIDLYHAIKSAYRGNAVFGMNSTTLAAIRKLKDGNGNYMVAMAGMNNAPVTSILGRPVLEMPDMPDIGSNTYPIIFGDFIQGYRIFDRVSISILRDPYSQATNGMTRFHGRRRVGAGVGKPEAIRKLKIATS
jgi:HK97 family phage major capsid protein